MYQIYNTGDALIFIERVEVLTFVSDKTKIAVDKSKDVVFVNQKDFLRLYKEHIGRATEEEIKSYVSNGFYLLGEELRALDKQMNDAGLCFIGFKDEVTKETYFNSRFSYGIAFDDGQNTVAYLFQKTPQRQREDDAKERRETKRELKAFYKKQKTLF